MMSISEPASEQAENKGLIFSMESIIVKSITGNTAAG